MSVASITIRPAPNPMEEAADQAYALLALSRQENPSLTPIVDTLTKVNNIMVDFIRNYPELMIPGDHPILLGLGTGICVLTVSFSAYIVTACVLYYVLYLLASSLQKQLPVLRIYSEKMNQFIEEITRLNPPQLNGLCQAILNKKERLVAIEEDLKKGSISPQESRRHLEEQTKTEAQCLFLEVVLQAFLKKMETASLQSRFIYEVRNQDKVTGYLIGTIHDHNWNIAHDTILLQTLDHCDLLFTEPGPIKDCLNQFIIKYLWDLMKHGLWVRTPYKYAVDFALSLHAQEKNISGLALDVNFNQELLLLAKKDIHWEGLSKDTMTKLMQIPGFLYGFLFEPDTRASIFARYPYLTGDEESITNEMEKLKLLRPNAHEKLLKERNLEWLNGKPQLLERLTGKLIEPNTDPEKPICVAAGAGHMFGEEGLVALLRTKGLTVTRLPQGPSS